MDKSSFFSSLGGYLKANKAFFLVVVFILLATGGYFWWQAGFTLDFNRFFAATPCEDKGLFDTMSECRSVCSQDPDACFFKPGEGCYKVPFGVSCQAACDPYGPPNCTKMPVDQNPDRGGCANATVPWGGTFDIPVGVTSYQAGTYHDPIAGCDRTTTEAGAGGTVTAWDNPPGTYSVKWDPALTPQKCGRYQFDVNLGPGQGVGKVFNYGVDCTATSVTHAVCANMMCGKVAGAGLDECTTETDCWKLACSLGTNTCARVAGTGDNSDGCTTEGAACGTAPTHSVCANMMCGKVAGAGIDECATETDCWKLTCTNNACVKVAGTGANEGGCTAEGGVCGTISEGVLCTSLKSQVNVNEAAQFTAEKGDGMYMWFAPTGIDAAMTGANSFSVKYTQPGFKTVTVASGGNQAVCTVTVLEPVVSSPPPAALACAPTTQTVALNSYATVNATGGSGAFTWATPSGTKDPATNCVNTATCRVSYSAAGTYDVTVSDQQSGSTQTVVCKVVVAAANQLLCAPTNQKVEVGDKARFDASGAASGSYTWSAPSGSPASASGASFETSYGSKGTYTVTVTSGTRTATCNVEATKGGGGGSYTHTVCQNNACIRVNGQGTSECFPVGSSCGSSSSPRLTLTKLVRNIAQGSGEGDSVTANPTDTVEFSLRISSNGSGAVRSVTIRDSLPAGLTYVPGSTTIDSVAASDGLISSGLSLGDMQSGRTITIRFRATVSAASFFSSGTSVLTNTGYARGSNVPEVSDSAFVTVMNAKNLNISLTKMGRNITRGETGERSPVRSSPAQTIEFVMHVRNTSANALNNVIIRDILPQEITLVAGSVRVGGVVAADVLTAAGLSLGTLTPGQEVVVMFSGLVASESQLPSGNMTVINTATVMATGIPMLSAQLPIVITNGIVIPTTDAGPGETTVLALIISAIITLLYVGYTSTETYRRREATDIAKDSRGGMSDFNT